MPRRLRRSLSYPLPPLVKTLKASTRHRRPSEWVHAAIADLHGELNRLKSFNADNFALTELVFQLPDEISCEIMVMNVHVVKPPVKESTEPIDLVLHSDVRAVEIADVDNYVAERLSFIEQIKSERERQQKWEEEEEIRRLRKELVPKAQSMPYFDRPFVPKRSMRPRTVPKEPRFHVRPMKSSCVSLLGR